MEGLRPDIHHTLEVSHLHPAAYFSEAEYLLGDEGMKFSRWVLGPYLEPEVTTSHRRNYSFELARLRVRSEQSIGILKGRWASLKELRLGISSDKAITHETDWVLACCILHNICRRKEDESPERVNDGQEPPVTVLSFAAGALEARLSIMERVCTFMRADGMYHEHRQ